MAWWCWRSNTLVCWSSGTRSTVDFNSHSSSGHCRWHQIRGQPGSPNISTIYQKVEYPHEDILLYADVWTELPIMPHSWTPWQCGKSLCHTINCNVRHQECVVKPPLSIERSYFQWSVGLTLDTHTYIFCTGAPAPAVHQSQRLLLTLPEPDGWVPAGGTTHHS